MASNKLVVEVIRAEGLSTASCTGVFVELRLEGENQRTTTTNDTVTPKWKERFSFDISEPDKLADLSLDAEVYSVDERSSNSRKFILGKVRLQGTRFVRLDEAVAESFTLKKRGMLSWGGNGKLVLYVFLEDVNHSNGSAIGDAAADNSTTANNVRAQGITEGQISELGRSAQVPTRPDFAVRSISPSSLGGGRIVDGWLSRVGRKDAVPSHDLVEVMWYIFVSVAKGRNLPAVSSMGSIDPYIEVKFGNYRAKTEYFQGKQNPEWGVVFAFSNDYMQSSKVEVVLKSRDAVRDDFVGMLSFDLKNVPTRVPSESALAAKWYKLMNRRMQPVNGELMLSVWKGTQADEAFHDAWHSDSATPIHPCPISSQLRSKEYSAPVLWYLKLDMIQAAVLVTVSSPRLAVYLRAQIGSQTRMTRCAYIINCSWGGGETLYFVVAEPFEENLILLLKSREGIEETIGSVVIPITSIDRRTDSREISPQWFHLHNLHSPNGNKPSAKVYIRLCLEGGYSAPVDSTCCSGDLRSTSDQLCTSQAIGLLELGIIRADALSPMKIKDGRATTDSYCVIKYGRKWVRTRTIIDSQTPRFNEQYAWDVYDPCTVLTIGVFDNCHVAINASDSVRDARIGKVRIRLSTLEAGRVYALSYPILILAPPSGVKKMGELQVTIRFSYSSLLSMCRAYLRPLLPVMHYTLPLISLQAANLQSISILVTATRLGQQEPPLREEVVEYICDQNSSMFSMRKVKSIFSRFLAVCSTFIAAYQLYVDIAMWKDPYLTVLCHVLFMVALCFPHLLLPVVPFCLFLLMLWNRRWRPRLPEHLDTAISRAEIVHPDELDEEFDTFPTSRPADIVRMRYDRMRSVAGRLQALATDYIVQMERVEALLRWRDPRATTMFTLFCLLAATALFIAPRVVALAAGLYVMRHPRFRGDTPSALLNLFSRLPSKQDCLM